MQIALLRHGKPKFPKSGWVSGNEFRDWLGTFNANGLSDRSLPPPELLKGVEKYSCVVCSDIGRSIESAGHLGLKEREVEDRLFREAELPHWNHSWLKLPPALWTALLRVLWLMGYSKDCESKSEAKARAERGAQKLIYLAEKEGSVLLVGHGIVNRYIAKELSAKGWAGPRSPRYGYWSFNVFKLPKF